MKTSCIRNPENNRYIQIHEWQVKFCQENHCAALILSFFINWHDWKIRNDQYYRRVNDIAEMHGDERHSNENAYLFFTMDDFIAGCMGFYSKKAINEAIDLLVSLDVISIHANPNPRYRFDKTRHFKFYPKICNFWIAENYPLNNENSDRQVADFSDRSKVADRYIENSQRLEKKEQPSNGNGQAITNNTNKLIQTNINKLIKSPNDNLNQLQNHFSQDPLTNNQNEKNSHVQDVIAALVEHGFSIARLQYPDTEINIENALAAGASVDAFVDAYVETCRIKKSESFAFNYLLKVVQTKLERDRQSKNKIEWKTKKLNNNQLKYESDYSKGMDWMGDLLG